MSAATLSDIRMQDLRRTLESDFGPGCQATVIVQNEQGEIVLFVSGGAAQNIESAIREYRSKLGS